MAYDIIQHNGADYTTGCLVPPVKVCSFPSLASAPGFTVWSKQDIIAAVNAKPYKRRTQFAGTDWILNQGNRGSCNCAAATGSLRRTMVIGGRNVVPQLSWEFLYAQLVDGNDSGSMLDDGMNMIMKSGIPPLDPTKHPLNRDIRKSNYSAEEYAAAKSWMAESCYQVHNELELATLLLSGQGAGVIAVHVGNSFMHLDSKGYIGADRGPGNHAVGVSDVEIIDGELAFDHNGSWGVDVHDQGYGYVNWARHLSQTSQYHAFYAIVGATNPGVK